MHTVRRVDTPVKLCEINVDVRTRDCINHTLKPDDRPIRLGRHSAFREEPPGASLRSPGSPCDSVHSCTPSHLQFLTSSGHSPSILSQDHQISFTSITVKPTKRSRHTPTLESLTESSFTEQERPCLHCLRSCTPVSHAEDE